MDMYYSVPHRMREASCGIVYTYLREASASVACSNRDGQCEGLSEWERATSTALTLLFLISFANEEGPEATKL